MVIKNGHRNFELAEKHSENVLTNIKVIPEEITFHMSGISVIKTVIIPSKTGLAFYNCVTLSAPLAVKLLACKTDRDSQLGQATRALPAAVSMATCILNTTWEFSKTPK